MKLQLTSIAKMSNFQQKRDMSDARVQKGAGRAFWKATLAERCLTGMRESQTPACKSFQLLFPQLLLKKL